MLEKTEGPAGLALGHQGVKGEFLEGMEKGLAAVIEILVCEHKHQKFLSPGDAVDAQLFDICRRFPAQFWVPRSASEFVKTEVIAARLKIANPLESAVDSFGSFIFEKGNGNPEIFVDG